MEGVLDRMRRNSLTPEKKTITILLKAVDLLKEMLTSLSSGNPSDFPQYGELIKAMESIKQMPQERHYKIIFSPDQDLFTRGIDLEFILQDLRGIGKILDIKAYTDAVPPLSEINPEKLYLRWDILLRTDSDPDVIREVFEFANGENEIVIIPAEAQKGTIPYLGQMLVDEGVIRAEDLDDALRSQRRLGEILVNQGKVTEKDIEQAIERQNERKITSLRHSVSSTIRVNLKKLDHLVNSVGEMVIIHSMIQQMLQSHGDGNEMSEQLNGVFSHLQRIGRDIQDSTMALMMLPVREIFQRFTRLVRELADAKHKNVQLILSGEETQLDKGVLEKITDPLIHLIRNAVDHGIEDPEERLSKGKPPHGTILLSSYQVGDSVYIEVEDDGRGLNKEKIFERALAAGIVTGMSDLTDEQIFNLIVLPGLSTAEKITDISGRGVGMDVVKKNVESLNGKVQIRTKPGSGTNISIKLPLTLAILDGLTVSIGDEVFVIPVSSVVESLRPDRSDVRTISEKGEVMAIRGEYIPLIRLYDVLSIPPRKRDPWEALVVVVQHEKNRYGIQVDGLIGQQQVVIKNLGAALPKVRDVASGTILGDGKIALVLDVPGIIANTMTITV
jgi:two-component system chemotaxis sensor kinase CheA